MQSQHNNRAIMQVRVIHSPQTGTGDSIILHMIYMVVPVVFFCEKQHMFSKAFFYFLELILSQRLITES
jgi:hypothetical protein